MIKPRILPTEPDRTRVMVASMTDDIDFDDFDFRHPDLRDKGLNVSIGELRMSHKVHLWPDQDPDYTEKPPRGRPRAISWLSILETVTRGVLDLCHGRPLGWVQLATYKNKNTAHQNMTRLKYNYAEHLPSGVWDFQIEISPLDENLTQLMARYSPQKFSDIKNIRKIPEEKRAELLESLQVYAEKKRNQAG